MIYDCVVIGGGTAGLTTAIYLRRAGKQVLVLEGALCGGQIINTPEVDNYPGIAHISGAEFAMNLYNQAASLGAKIEYEKAVNIVCDENGPRVVTERSQYETKTVVLAAGVHKRLLGLPKEKELTGAGVSYCATCDGAFFRDQVVAVNGGGNTAIEDALYLADLCQKVYLIHRRGEFRGDNESVMRMAQCKNIELLLHATIDELRGDKRLEEIVVNQNGEKHTLKVSGLFVAIGQIPDNRSFADWVQLTDDGFVKATENTCTKTPWMFAAGDCREKMVRQLTTAAADGAIASAQVVQYLQQN